MELFQSWYEDARDAGLVHANAMVLSTAGSDGRVSSRVVLLKDYNHKGMVFYSNYTSAKARQLTESPLCALNFFWGPLACQVRVEGKVSKLDADSNSAYFATRDRVSQLGAWASQQSAPLSSRADLQRSYQQIEQQYAEQPVPRPKHWGGYLVTADLVEFWAGKQGRLHERLRYSMNHQGEWEKQLLQP